MICLQKSNHLFGCSLILSDDILDITSTSETMGKTVGKDVIAEKSTYPALLGLEGAREAARSLTRKALDSLAVFGEQDGARLRQLADFLLNRDY